MGEGAVSLAAPAATPAPITPATDTANAALPGAGTGASTAPADPFADLLSTLSTAAGAVPPPAPAPAIPAAILAVPSSPESADAADRDDKDAAADTDATADPLGDPLADAIAQGMTAVLALGQPAPPPSSTTTVSSASRAAIATVAARAPTLLATPAPATDDPDAAPVAPGLAQAAYSPAVVAALRAAVSATRTPAAPSPRADAACAMQAIAAAPAIAADADTAPIVAQADAAPQDARHAAEAAPPAVQAPRAPGLTARVAAAAQPRAARTDTRRLPEMPQAAAFAAASLARDLPGLATDPTGSAPAAPADIALQQTLTIAHDGQWLDSLARDIAMSAGNGGGDLQFKLNPAHLGALTVQIAQGADGASIRMTTDSDATRNILVDAQPRLIAEARAQGLKVSDTHVDLGQPNGGGSAAMRHGDGSAGQSGQHRPPLPDHQPFAGSTAGDADSAESADDSNALYA